MVLLFYSGYYFVTENTETIFTRASLAKYTLKQRLFVYVADLTLYLLITGISMTVRVRTTGNEHTDAIAAQGKVPIIAAWHDNIFLGVYYLRNRRVAGLASLSFDGEYIARLVQRLGFGVVRGSSSRGGAAALIEMARVMRDGFEMCLTVDGPRGPRHIAKFGAISLAKRSGNPIVPFAIRPDRFITLRSWDRMLIPIPFTSAEAVFGEPIYVAADGDADDDRARFAELQSALDRMAGD